MCCLPAAKVVSLSPPCSSGIHARLLMPQMCRTAAMARCCCSALATPVETAWIATQSALRISKSLVGCSLSERTVTGCQGR